jgi:hypothetical protein
VIPEYRQPFDLIALALAGEKTKTAPEEAVDCDLEKWLPADHDHRTNPFAVFEDSEGLYLHYRARQPVLLLTPREEKTRVLGSRRRWVQNPILIAREMERDLKRSKKANQSTVAKKHGVTRTRVCQYLRLLTLHGNIVAYMENPDNDEAAASVTESALRELLKLRHEGEIQRAFKALLLNPEQRP